MSLRSALALVLAFAGGASQPAPALASVDVTPGMRIVTDGEVCTLGFLAGNDAGDALAVTAGHCSRAAGQVVRTGGGAPIGVVASRRDDHVKGGWYGYTLIALNAGAHVSDYFFTGTANATKGDAIRKYGGGTQGANGRIVDVRYSGDCPECSILTSDVVALPGDSGGPWYEPGPTLVGITIASDSTAQHRATISSPRRSPSAPCSP